jgi:hypothetical protein
MFCRREVERGAAKRQPLTVAANTVGECAMPRERLFIGGRKSWPHPRSSHRDARGISAESVRP